MEWKSAIVEANFDVAFGDGTITNILAYRKFDLFDVDATPSFIFHSEFTLDQEQISNELRYSGKPRLLPGNRYLAQMYLLLFTR